MQNLKLQKGKPLHYCGFSSVSWAQQALYHYPKPLLISSPISCGTAAFTPRRGMAQRFPWIVSTLSPALINIIRKEETVHHIQHTSHIHPTAFLTAMLDMEYTAVSYALISFSLLNRETSHSSFSAVFSMNMQLGRLMEACTGFCSWNSLKAYAKCLGVFLNRVDPVDFTFWRLRTGHSFPFMHLAAIYTSPWKLSLCFWDFSRCPISASIRMPSK